MRNYSLIFIIILLISCDKDQEQLSTDRRTKLIGPWDAYYGIYSDNSVEGLQIEVLFNYEHGFEIFDNGIYKSRYAVGTTLNEGLITELNPDSNSGGTWKLQKDTLTFLHTFQDVTDSVHFKVIYLDNVELKIRSTEPNENRTFYLRKAK